MHQPRRVSLRHVDDDGAARDLVGDLVLADDQRLVVLPADRGPVEVPRSSVQALREVPPRPVRPTSRVDDLQLLMGRGWPAAEVVRLGGWRLHAGDGATRWANSALPVGDPGRPLPDAVDAVVAFSGSRGITPSIRVARRTDEAPGGLDAELDRRGWAAVEPTTVMVLDLRWAELPVVEAEVTWGTVPDDRWQAPSGGLDADHLAEMTVVDALYATATDSGAPVAAGRLAVVGEWAGLSHLVVAEGRRGRGHGRALATAMVARARQMGLGYCWVAVADGEAAAQGIFRGLGFVEHHRYHHREPVS